LRSRTSTLFPYTTLFRSSQIHTETGEITYGYCTECLIELKDSKTFDEVKFKRALDKRGDSLLVVSDANLVKVHIHTEEPGDILRSEEHTSELQSRFDLVC